jgi:ribosome-binding factor A
VEAELFETLSTFLRQGWGRTLPCYASISSIQVSADLRSARVFFRLVGGDTEARKAEELLLEERNLFQKAVAREIKMKFCPVLRFEFGVAAQLDEVDALLENLLKPKRQFGED